MKPQKKMNAVHRKPRALKTEERKAWERDQRINRLVDITQELFFAHGYDGTTVDDIARAAGYTKRSIYLYFRDREELFLAVVHRGQLLFRSALEQALAEDYGSGEALVLRLGRAFYRFSIEHHGHFNLLLTYESRLHRYHSSQTEGDRDEGQGFRALCQRLSNEYGELVTGAIGEDMRAGRIRSRLTARQLMLVLWGQALGVMQIIIMRTRSFSDAYGISPEKLFEEYLRMASKSLQ